MQPCEGCVPASGKCTSDIHRTGTKMTLAVYMGTGACSRRQRLSSLSMLFSEGVYLRRRFLVDVAKGKAADVSPIHSHLA